MWVLIAWLSILLVLLVHLTIRWYKEKIKVQTINNEFQAKATELQAKHAEVQAKANELQAEKSELQAKANELQAEKSELQAKANELQAENSELQSKITELQSKTTQISVLQQEKDLLHAKYLTKLTASQVKKKNLEAYYVKQQQIRKSRSIQEQIADIVGKGDKWLPHSCTEPKTHKIGKPKDTHGGGRPRPLKIHGVIDLHVHSCSCGADLKDVPEFFVYSSIITELYREQEDEQDYQCLKLKNMDLRHVRKQCPNCGRWNYPRLGLLKNARFGLGLVTSVMSKRIETGLPYKRLIRDLIKQFGPLFSLSAPSIIDWFLKFEDQLKDMYNQLAALVKRGEFMGIDESGLPMNGENWWIWILCSANITFYQISASRGHQSVEGILEGFKGTIISDFFRAYDKLDQEHQKCLAHLLSAIIELMVGLKKENKRIENSIATHENALAKEQAAKDAETKKKRGRPPKEQKLSRNELELLQQRKETTLKTLNQAGRLCAFFRRPFQETTMGWKTRQTERMTADEAQEQLTQLIRTLREEGITDSTLETLIKRCEKYQSELFTYLKHEGMPPDNNQSERGLRHYACQRKVSGGFKSPKLMEHYVVYLSLYMTCQANGKDFDRLLALLMSEKRVDLEQFLFSVT